MIAWLLAKCLGKNRLPQARRQLTPSRPPFPLDPLPDFRLVPRPRAIQPRLLLPPPTEPRPTASPDPVSRTIPKPITDKPYTVRLRQDSRATDSKATDSRATGSQVTRSRDMANRVTRSRAMDKPDPHPPVMLSPPTGSRVMRSQATGSQVMGHRVTGSQATHSQRRGSQRKVSLSMARAATGRLNPPVTTSLIRLLNRRPIRRRVTRQAATLRPDKRLTRRAAILPQRLRQANTRRPVTAPPTMLVRGFRPPPPLWPLPLPLPRKLRLPVPCRCPATRHRRFPGQPTFRSAPALPQSRKRRRQRRSRSLQ